MKVKVLCLALILVAIVVAACEAPTGCDFTNYHPVQFECEWARSIDEQTIVSNFDSPPPPPTSTATPTQTPTPVPVYTATSIFGEYNIYGEIEARGTEVASPPEQYCPWFDSQPEPGCENHNPNAPSRLEIDAWIVWYWETNKLQLP